MTIGRPESGKRLRLASAIHGGLVDDLVVLERERGGEGENQAAPVEEGGAESLEAAKDGPAEWAEAGLLQLLPHVLHRLSTMIRVSTPQVSLGLNS